MFLVHRRGRSAVRVIPICDGMRCEADVWWSTYRAYEGMSGEWVEEIGCWPAPEQWVSVRVDGVWVEAEVERSSHKEVVCVLPDGSRRVLLPEECEFDVESARWVFVDSETLESLKNANTWISCDGGV